MNIIITINTDNAAFEDDPGAEVARILNSLAQKIGRWGIPSDMKLLDSNGNTVGKCDTVADDEPDTETADEWRNTPA